MALATASARNPARAASRTSVVDDDLQLFDVAETCKRLRICRTRLYAAVKSGELRMFRNGSRLVADRSVLESYIGQLKSRRAFETHDDLDGVGR